MFTGIVAEVGEVRTFGRSDARGVAMEIACSFDGLNPGESIAVDGACLTVEQVGGSGFSVQVVPTTVERTNFGHYTVGRRVNLERALTPGDRLGGHMVQGHVDGVAEVLRSGGQAGAWLMDLRVPDEAWRVSIPLGSITVDGVSLTVNALPSVGVIQVSLIPFTLQHSTLGERKPGDRVHVESDVLGKYVAGLLEKREARSEKRGA
jgi:riboflavin synthase